jgi:DNA-binding GntR family transcriptional regulator
MIPSELSPRALKSNRFRQILDLLRSSILSGKLAPGLPLREVQLAQQFECSRAPVREALMELEREGIVEIKATGRARVRPFCETDMLELVEMRLALESMAARRVAPVWTREDSAWVERSIEAQIRSETLRDLTGLDVDMHRYIVERAGNSRLTAAWNVIRPQFEMWLAHTHRLQDRVEMEPRKVTVEAHRLILAALESGNGDSAGRVMTEHVESWLELYPRSEEPKKRGPFGAFVGPARNLVLGLGALLGVNCSGTEPNEFFQKQVLPVLEKRCFECHSHRKKIKGGLALDSRAGWEKGGDSGPAVVSGSVEESLIIKAVRRVEEDIAMPPKGKLPDEEVAILEQWVRKGAQDPRESKLAKSSRGVDLESGRKFWAFQPVSDPGVPEVREKKWCLDPVDHFLADRWEKKGVRPAGDADRWTWLRRVSLDLTGLPPSPDEIQEFVADNSPEACERVVDRLLGSQAYGERWGRHWLDLTGYADMMGTSNEVYAEHAWRYRDWVIGALNADLSFDQFIVEQIAGDLLHSSDEVQRAARITATGFLMVGDIEIVNPDKAKLEADHVDTQVSKIGQAFLGMTLGCVRCHDHKFDPIGLEDYYGMAGILRSSPSSHKWPDMGVWSALNTTVLPETPAQKAARLQLEAESVARIAALREDLGRTQAEKADTDRLIAALQEPPKLSQSEPAFAGGAGAGQDSPGSMDLGEVEEPQSAVGVLGDGDFAARRKELAGKQKELGEKLKNLQRDIQHAEFFRDKTPKAFSMSDGPKPGDMPVYIRGNPYATGAVVPRGALRVASWEPFPAIAHGQSGRLELARWISDRRNPLTARVAVNRIWQKLFGRGIVPSVDYFGVRGELPSHPELLDHLATRFMAGGWSQKKLVKSLVLSRAYRLSGVQEPESQRRDPENALFWRMKPQRLESEVIRDAMLAASGELRRESGGPALVLENPVNCGSLALKGTNPPTYAHRASRLGQELERTIYQPVMRNAQVGGARIGAFFDFVDPAMTAGQRPQTIVPTQTLFLLNNSMVRQRAQQISSLVLKQEKRAEVRLEILWAQVLGRPVRAEERESAFEFLADVSGTAGQKDESAAWCELCHALLGSNEFVFKL